MLYNQYLRLPILHKHVCSLILHNLEVHKPHMRKTYLNLYLTEPLWRIIEPLRRNMKPRCGMIEPLWRKTELHCGIIEPLWGNIEHFSFKGKHNHLSYSGNIDFVYRINKSYLKNQNLKLQGEWACQTTVQKSSGNQVTIYMKAVVNHYENYYGIIILGNCNMLDLNIDYSLNERSITVYKLTVRKHCKQLKINGHLHWRDREPSRIPVKKVIQTMRKRKLQQKFKRILRK